MDVPPHLGPDDVHVWTALLTQSEPCPEWLDDAELRRADRFLLPWLRTDFIRSHTMLRQLLATYLGCDPASLAFVVGDHGKPTLVGGADLQFNASHSDDCLVVAIRRGHPIGIDVERHRDLPDASEIAARFFTPAEASEIRALPAADRANGFRALWTLKEAVVKAAGEALAYHLDRIEGTLDPAGSARLVAWHGMGKHGLADWATFPFAPAPGYSATLATRAPLNPARIRFLHPASLRSRPP